MAVSNGQARSAAFDSRNVISCACADVASWLAAAARELHESLVPPVDLVFHAYKEDLRSKKTPRINNSEICVNFLKIGKASVTFGDPWVLQTSTGMHDHLQQI